ncbi:MAG: hypothetical protein FWE95_02875 [Planctomycetaceae bacterium]|nr:hypothetical protein [Planctomycetaceae bacterium]
MRIRSSPELRNGGKRANVWNKEYKGRQPTTVGNRPPGGCVGDSRLARRKRIGRSSAAM